MKKLTTKIVFWTTVGVLATVLAMIGIVVSQIGYQDSADLVSQFMPIAVEGISSLAFLLAIVLVPVAIYFIPGFVGNKTKHYAAIWMLNLLLGWTILGWIGALIWALASPKRVQVGAVGEGRQESS